MNNFKTTMISLCFLSTLCPGAHAALSLVGPIDPSHGFPKWYKDTQGTRLTLCLERTPICALEDINVNLPVRFPTNFPGEALWWGADARVRFGNPRAEVRLIYALEAAFANEVPRAGDRVSFGRIRIRGRGLSSGTYRITHPFGVEVYQVDETGERQINESRDIGIEPEVFTGALQSGIGPFLAWDPTVPPLAPEGFIGDPEVPHRVIGSPRGTNYLRVERLVGGFYSTVAFTDEFNVLGKLAVGPEEPILTASPKGGIYRTPQTVTISSTVPGAEIFYTLDGSHPRTSSTRVLYTGPINLPGCAALRFAATNGRARSELSTELYVRAQ